MEQIDWTQVTTNQEVIELLKQREIIEQKIIKLDPSALIKYEIEVISKVTMETDKIPTSEEILDILIPNKYNVSKEENEDSLKQNKETLIGWVELHIQEALKYASEKGTVIYVMDDNRGCYYQVCKESILKSYPLSKIK